MAKRQTQPSPLNAAKDPFNVRCGQSAQVDADYPNEYFKSAVAANGLDKVPMFGVDSNNALHLNGSGFLGAKIPIQGFWGLNALQGTQGFFVNKSGRTLRITAIEYTHGTACTTAGTVTATITKESGTQAPGAGTAVMTSTFNPKGTVNVVQYATLNSSSPVDGSVNPYLLVADGERLSIKFSTATLTSLANVAVTVFAIPGHTVHYSGIYINGNTRIQAAEYFDIALTPKTINSIVAIWSTKGSDAGAVTLDITKDTGTTAPGAGTSVLASTISLKGTANTNNVAVLSATAANLTLAPSDRLSYLITGATTALAGLQIYVFFNPVYGQVPLTINIPETASFATQPVFVADRTYQVADVAAAYAVAGTSTALDLLIERGTTAVGSGSTILTGAIDCSATAATAYYGTLVASRSKLLIGMGDRLTAKISGTTTSSNGLTAKVVLIPV